MEKTIDSCSFCYRHRKQTKILVQGEHAAICGECLDIAKNMSDAKLKEYWTPKLPVERKWVTEFGG